MEILIVELIVYNVKLNGKIKFVFCKCYICYV